MQHGVSRRLAVVFMEGALPQTFGEGERVWGLGYSTNLDGSGGHYDVYQANGALTRRQPSLDEPNHRDVLISNQHRNAYEPKPKIPDRDGGTHTGIRGIKATFGLLEGKEVVVKTQLILSEQLGKTCKKLQN